MLRSPPVSSAFKGFPSGKSPGSEKLGFAVTSDTALGAEHVSAETVRIIRESGQKLFLSSACPAAVDYIRKYAPEYTPYIVPVVSPVMAHAKMLKQKFGETAKVIFFGPCAAKKMKRTAPCSDRSR